MDLVSGQPFWSAKDGLIRAYPTLRDVTECTVAVLGGGITGALVAYHLVEAGIDTVVLDKREIGWGSTAASTALLQYEIDTTLADLCDLRGAEDAARAYLVCRNAVDKLAELARRIPGSHGFERKKSLYLAARKRDRKVLRKEWEMRRAIGLNVDWLDESDISERFPFRRKAALLTHDAAQVDPYAFTHGLLREASARGGRVFDRTDVTRIKSTTNGVRLETAEGCEVRARWLVFATGYETQTFLDHPVAKLASTYAIVSEPDMDLTQWGEGQCLIWEHASPYLYMRTTGEGRVIVGGEDEKFRSPARRDAIIGKKSERLKDRFRDLFPDIDFPIAFAWSGTFGETEDGLAYIGEHRDWPHAYFALGYGGNGITFGLIAAEIIRDLVLGQENSDADLFRFDR